MKKRTIKNIMFMTMEFVLCFRLATFIVDKWSIGNIACIQFLSEIFSGTIELIRVLISVFLGFVSENAIEIIKLYFVEKRNNKKENFKINITVKDVTCLRKTKKKITEPEIVIEKGNQFIYVLCEVKKIGKKEIKTMVINGIELNNILLSPNKGFLFQLRLCKDKTKKFRKAYSIEMIFTDEEGKNYEKKYRLKINEERHSATLSCNFNYWIG